MPIDTTLAGLSNGLLLAAVLLYALAMLCYAGDFAFARHRVLAGLTDAAVAGTAVPEAAVPSLVAAGAGGPAVPVTVGTSVAATPVPAASAPPPGAQAGEQA
ncbi:MAG: hypothetical protein WBH47_06555, partial [Streptosporangiaceae bacterium]